MQPQVQPSQPTLTFHQFRRVKDILKKREYNLAKTQRVRDLQRFKQQAKKGAHDVQLPVFSWASVVLKRPDLPDKTGSTITLQGSIFNRPVNPVLLHQLVRWQLAKRRKGLASSKTRAEVRGGGRKPHAQKGTGRARQGTIRAPHMRGGGITFGPKPRSFAFALPKKIRRAGLLAALSAKFQQKQVIIVDSFVLSDKDAQAAVSDLVADNLEYIRAVDVYKIPKQFLLRAVVYDGIARDTSVFGAGKDGAVEPYSDEQVLENIMRKFDEQEVYYQMMLVRTGWFVRQFKALLQHVTGGRPWEKLKPSMAESNDIVAALNSGFSESRLARLKEKRKPAERLSALVIDSAKDGSDGGSMLRKSIANVPTLNVVPAAGANVYDILRHDYLVITQPGLEALLERLTRPLNRGFKPVRYDWKAWVAEKADKARKQKELRAKFDSWLAERKAAAPSPSTAA